MGSPATFLYTYDESFQKRRGRILCVLSGVESDLSICIHLQIMALKNMAFLWAFKTGIVQLKRTVEQYGKNITFNPIFQLFLIVIGPPIGPYRNYFFCVIQCLVSVLKSWLNLNSCSEVYHWMVKHSLIKMISYSEFELETYD